MSHGTDVDFLDVDAGLDGLEQILRVLKEQHGLGVTKARVLDDLGHLLDGHDVGMDSRRAACSIMVLRSSS